MSKKRNNRFAMSRNRRRTFIIMGVLLFVALGLVDRWGGKGVREVILRPRPKGVDAKKYHRKSFAIKKIVDGDTVDIDIADGEYEHTRIRLLGVDTPETKDPRRPEMYFGQEASDFAAQVLEGKDVMVIIDTVSDVRDRYGRLLAYIEVDGKIFNEMLIRKGFGYADLRFKHGEFDRYAAMQEEAVKAKVGLWEEVTQEDLPGWLRREKGDILSLRAEKGGE